MVHRQPVYIYLLNVPSFSSHYFNKIKRTSRLGRLLALSLEILRPDKISGILFRTLMVFLKVLFKKWILKKNQQTTKTHAKFPSRHSVNKMQISLWYSLFIAVTCFVESNLIENPRQIFLSHQIHTGQCKRTGGCCNELVVAFLRTGGGLKGEKIYTCWLYDLFISLRLFYLWWHLPHRPTVTLQFMALPSNWWFDSWFGLQIQHSSGVLPWKVLFSSKTA